MKKIKKLQIGLVLGIATLLCLQVGAIHVENTNDNPPLNFPNATTMSKGELKRVQQTTSLQDNIQISDVHGIGTDDVHPGITQDLNGNIAVAFTEEYGLLDKRMSWAIYDAALDQWNQFYFQEEAYDTYNDVALVNGPVYYGLFGVFIQPADEVEGFYLMPDPLDPGTWVFYTWMGDALEVSYACISDNSYLEGQYHDMNGPVNHYIEHLIYGDYDISDCPNQMITGFDENGDIVGGESTFDGQGGPHGTNPFATAPASDPDMSNEFMKTHHVWQFNDPEGPTKIVWKMIIPVEGDTDSTDIEYTPYQKYLGEGEHPAIAHYGTNIAVVYTSGGNVMCVYSSDDGTTWNTATISPGTYPDICAAGNIFRCVYALDGNLFVIESEDGGATWGTSAQVNDQPGTVVEEENAIDVHPAGIVWTDNRNGNKDIYFSKGGAKPEPKIGIKEVKGGIGVTAVIENTGDADATDVEWSISFEGGLIFIGGADGTIDVPAGGEEEVSSGFVLGLGKTMIIVTANSAQAEQEGTVILFFVLV
jgi:hypothetical protein